jgi:hypothetical protein
MLHVAKSATPTKPRMLVPSIQMLVNLMPHISIKLIPNRINRAYERDFTSAFCLGSGMAFLSPKLWINVLPKLFSMKAENIKTIENII